MDSGSLLSTDYRVQYKTYGSERWVDDLSHGDYNEIRERSNALHGSQGIAAVRVLLVSIMIYKEVFK